MHGQLQTLLSELQHSRAFLVDAAIVVAERADLEEVFFLSLFYKVYVDFCFQRIPASIQELHKLRVLDLGENNLDCLPTEIGMFFYFKCDEQ